MFLETSAKTGHSVEEAFLKCSKNILAKIETGELDPERIGSGIACLITHFLLNRQYRIQVFSMARVFLDGQTNCQPLGGLLTVAGFGALVRYD